MRKLLVEEAPTSSCPTVTVEFAAGILNGKFVIVRELLPSVDLPQSKDDDMLATFHINHSGVAVGFT